MHRHQNRQTGQWLAITRWKTHKNTHKVAYCTSRQRMTITISIINNESIMLWLVNNYNLCNKQKEETLITRMTIHMETTKPIVIVLIRETVMTEETILKTGHFTDENSSAFHWEKNHNWRSPGFLSHYMGQQIVSPTWRQTGHWVPSCACICLPGHCCYNKVLLTLQPHANDLPCEWFPKVVRGRKEKLQHTASLNNKPT